MKTELEPHDIEAIAQRVLEVLKPILFNLEKTGDGRDTIFDGSPLTLKRGQLLFGLNAAHRDTGISIKRLRKRMVGLEAGNFLEPKKGQTNTQS